MSDSNGYIYDPEGIDREKLDFIMELKNVRRGRIKEYADKYGCKYVENARPWNEKGDIALPSATQNEINGDDAKALVANGAKIGESSTTTKEIVVSQTTLGASTNIGGIAGYITNSAIINNAISYPSVIGHSNIGGIVGYAGSSTIKNSQVQVLYNINMKNIIAGYNNVGGIVGKSIVPTKENAKDRFYESNGRLRRGYGSI